MPELQLTKFDWPDVNGDYNCYDTSILVAFDANMNDGFDVFSISLGCYFPNYFQDGMSIASFHVVQIRKIVVGSTINDGPNPWKVENVAPWIITVAASTIDRQYPSYAIL